ncbi:MAG: hypothetical protein WD673_07375 [Alphaproteobacteria bacterium]
MVGNVIHLPRPRSLRTGHEPLAFYVRVGRNDHIEVLELLTAGERGIFGFVVEAPYLDRHEELITEARKRNFDVILDPRTQQMGLPGSYSDALIALPWGKSERHHTVADFEGQSGRARAAKIVEFALSHGCTQLLGPTHLIADPNDPWVHRDIAMMSFTAECIQRAGGNLGLIYPLALPMSVFRDDVRRSAIVAAIGSTPCDAMWLKIENFGDSASGEKATAYIRACRDFHARGLPLVADHIGGLPALGTLAFGAVGGIAHGVTMNQSFGASSWRRPRQEGGGSIPRRIYLPELDMLVMRNVAERFIASSPRVRGRHVCRDTHCCARGLSDMLDRPARHALHQRAREIEKLGSVPHPLRIANYLENARRVSDEVALAASFDKVDEEFRRKLGDKQKALGHFREAMAHLATSSSGESVAIPPLRRAASGGPSE